MQKYLAKRTLLLVGIVLLLHVIATLFYWYTSINNFDKIMHTIGGVFIAVLAAMFFWSHIEHLGWRDSAVALLLMVLIIGLAWEYYEYIVQYFIKDVHLADINDSITDMMCDMLGGIIGTAFVLRAKKRYNTVHARIIDK